jgi:hypothetical protein
VPDQALILKYNVKHALLALAMRAAGHAKLAERLIKSWQASTIS